LIIFSIIESGHLLFETVDGWLGYSKGQPYDAIHVGAGASTLPEELVKQLKVGGKMFIPVGGPSCQVIKLITRTKDSGPIDESYTETELMPVRYVPLVHTPSPPESPTDL
jgi:protein-L-isoaspartate(D-aspartate) O-methyltransferase